MKQRKFTHRHAAAMIFVAAAIPFTPSLAQDAAAPPVINVPPPVAATPPVANPAPATPTMGVSIPVRGPVVEHVASPGAAPAAAAVTRTARAVPVRAAAPVRTASATRSSATARSAAASEAAAPAAATTAPSAAAAGSSTAADGSVSAGAAPSLAAPAAGPAPAPAPTTIAPVSAPLSPERTPLAWWPFVAGLLVIAAAAAVLAARRRRRAEDEVVHYDEPVYEAPAPEPQAVAEYQEPIVAPVYAEPTIETAAEQSTEIELGQPDPADIEALAATAAPHPDRPWLEFLMRPVRGGASDDEARVEFELTVGNTGAVPARDVRVSTWMLASGEGTDMEHSLIEPAGAAHSELQIAAGEGAKVEATMAMPRDDNRPVLPVVVADARYTLPDGSEGRTSASFAIGMPGAGGIRPFRTGSGLTEDVEAELHGEPERV